MTNKALFKSLHSICVKQLGNKENVPSLTPPIYASSTFVYDDLEKTMNFFKGEGEAYIYSRWDNPTVNAVEDKIACLEGYELDQETKAVMFSSGMAAISAVFMGLELKPNDTVIVQGNIYGTTIELLNTVITEIGVNVIYTDLKNLVGLNDLLKKTDNVKAIYLETPANPLCSCYDLVGIADLANHYKVKTIVDNTFATPILQQPLHFGIDVVVHSATKYLNGHGTGLSGVVVSTDIDFMKNRVWKMRKLMGGTCSPFEAFLLDNGLKTLAIRMERHCDNAILVAQFLEKQEAVKQVYYPGLPSHPEHGLAGKQMYDYGGMLSFELKDGLEAGKQLMRNIKFCTLTASLGTTETLIQHPASMSHVSVPLKQREHFGITDGLIRMSVGIEDVEDIMRDLGQAIT